MPHRFGSCKGHKFWTSLSKRTRSKNKLPFTIVLACDDTECLRRNSNKVLHTADDGGTIFKIPGLKHDDFNRAGIPSVFKLMRMDEISHNLYSAGNSDSGGSGATVTTVEKVRVWTFTPEFYRRAAINFPLVAHHRISRIGRSSFDVNETFLEDKLPDDKACKLPLITCVGRVVCVDTTTARSTPWPKGLIEKLSINHISDGEALPIVTPPTSIPDNAFKWRIRVRFDDTNYLFHTNQAAYVLYCLECAAQAASQRYLPQFVDDIAFYPVRRVAGIHIAETEVGDKLDVYSWNDDGDKMRLHFVIMKAKVMVYCAQIDFFDSVLIPSSL